MPEELLRLEKNSRKRLSKTMWKQSDDSWPMTGLSLTRMEASLTRCVSLG